MNRMLSVYLAGPISGLNYDSAQDWRDDVKHQMEQFGVKAFSPLRAKEYLRGIPALTKDCKGYGDLNPMSSPRGIYTRDRYDATTCDVLFVNFLGAKSVSIGTVLEIAWADSKDIPIVLVMEEEGNVHEHAMVNECVGFRVYSIEEGVKMVQAIADNRKIG